MNEFVVRISMHPIGQFKMSGPSQACDSRILYRSPNSHKIQIQVHPHYTYNGVPCSMYCTSVLHTLCFVVLYHVLCSRYISIYTRGQGRGQGGVKVKYIIFKSIRLELSYVFVSF